MGIISGSGSFRGQFGDHFRVGDHFGVGIISGAVQASMGDSLSHLDDLLVQTASNNSLFLSSRKIQIPSNIATSLISQGVKS